MIKAFKDVYGEYSVHMIPCREDNYTFILEKNKCGVLIDSSLYEPVSKYLKENQIKLEAILITHHHYDHVDGIKEIADEHECRILCSQVDYERDAVPEAHDFLNEDSALKLIGLDFKVIETPGHTAGHISFYIESLDLLFCADTLFSLGCGRVFPDGSFESLFTSLQKISKLPENTIIYCAHEYTKSNFYFLSKNSLLDPLKGDEIERRLLNEQRTVPTSLKYETHLNSFLKCSTQEEFTHLRKLKDKG